MPRDGDMVDELKSGRLRLRFVWSGDRLSHSITHGASTLNSIDQTACETPVYVELHRQGNLVFLSGHSDDRIWSASIEPIEGGFLFDVACRLKSPATRLGAAYLMNSPQQLGPFIEAPEAGVCLVGKAVDGGSPCTLQTTAQFVTIDAPATAEPAPHTRRFRYAALLKSDLWIHRESPAVE
jgi:hypothetical protein